MRAIVSWAGVCGTIISLVNAAAWCAEAAPHFPATFGDWARERVGPVVFPEGSSKTWEDFTGLAVKLGARAVKTWVGTDKPGDALARIQSEPYRALIRQFKVVHFNVSPAYIVKDYRPGVIASDALKAIETEWRDITRTLCRERTLPDQICLLSVGGELNVYVGTANAYPEFPVAEYVNACHAGKEAALAEFDPSSRPAVFSVAELQSDIEFDRFAAQWVSQFNTDLVSLSYYTFYRPLDDALAILRPHVKSLGPFGDQRLMLGEYGPSLESCNGNQAEQARWHDDILHHAFNAHLQFAFFYEIADHEAVIKTGSHDGLVGYAPEPYCRLTWGYYQRLYAGEQDAVPQIDLYEARPPKPPPNAGDPRPSLAVTDLNAPSTQPRAGDRLSFTATVTNAGTAPAQDTTVNFFVDDRLTAWVWFAPLAPDAKVTLASSQGDPRFTWTAREGRHRVTAVVDPLGRNDDPNRDDNARRLWLDVLPATPSAPIPTGSR